MQNSCVKTVKENFIMIPCDIEFQDYRLNKWKFFHSSLFILLRFQGHARNWQEN